MIKTFKQNRSEIQEEWNSEGANYAKEINEMVEFGEKNGWENWEGEEPEDNREHLADEVISLLKQASLDNNVDNFRANFPPSHAPIISFLEKQSQSIQQLHFIDKQKIVFLTGNSYEERQAYLLDNDQTLELDKNINAIGKSKQNNIFAIATEDKISTLKGWEGELLLTVSHQVCKY